MGTWGYGIFDDDTASDARDTFEDAIGDGLNVDKASDRVFEVFRDQADDYDCGPVILITLAELQIERGEIQAEVRVRALGALAQNIEGREEAGPDEVAQRKAVLDDFRPRLERAS
jgi:hypothetical protein